MFFLLIMLQNWLQIFLVSRFVSSIKHYLQEFCFMKLRTSALDIVAAEQSMGNLIWKFPYVS